MEDKGFYVTELPPTGEVTILAALLEKELRPKRSGGMFLHLKLADRTGEIDAKVWDRPEEIAQKIERDCVVKVRGTLEQYNDKAQLVVARIRTCQPDEYSPSDFYPTSDRDPEELYGQLLSFIEMVGDRNLRNLLQRIAADPDVALKLKVAPAALRIHHAWRSGLLEHIVSLCELATLLAGKDARLDLDWLIAGALLHDIGKIETLTIQGVRFTYTARGQLLEHVALGLEILNRFVVDQPEFPASTKAMLQHLIISHHGDLDKGALRLPMTPEAIALSILDLLDARLEQAFRLLAQAPGDDAFTPYIPSLERQLYRVPKAVVAQEGATP
jgi:3'-5' exoribonuclease